MKVSIRGRINVEGKWWDVTSEHIVDDELTPAQKVAQIKAIISGIEATSEIISTVAVAMPPQQVEPEAAAQAANSGAAMPQQLAIPPVCKVHRDRMAQSKTQRDDTVIHYYCTQKDDQGYCKHRAKVTIETGIPVFWTVK